jgi:hypothetical protein
MLMPQNQMQMQLQGAPQQMQQQDPPVQQQQQSSSNPSVSKQNNKSVKQKAKVTQQPVSTLKAGQKEAMGYEDSICFNCGEPGHSAGTCSLPKACHICKKLNHDSMIVRSKGSRDNLPNSWVVLLQGLVSTTLRCQPISQL